jgi:hypothetical protein
MSKPETEGHNSKKSKKVVLHKLQRKILIQLSENRPMTINETATTLNEHYKATWNAFKKLEKMNAITKVGSKTYQNNEYPLFWVTEDGAILALCEDANQSRVLRRAFRIYPNNRNLHFALEIMPIFGLDAFKLVCTAFTKKGKLDDSDKAQIYATQMQNKFTFIEALSKMNVNMERLLKQLKNSEEKE